MNEELDSEIINYNKVKDIVLNKLIEEGMLDQDDAEEFRMRCQILVYKGKWFDKWFTKNVSADTNDKEKYYIKIVEVQEKEDSVTRLLRKTTGDCED